MIKREEMTEGKKTSKSRPPPPPSLAQGLDPPTGDPSTIGSSESRD